MRLKSLLSTYLPRLGLTGGSTSNGLSGGRDPHRHDQHSSGKKIGGGGRLASDVGGGPARRRDEAQFTNNDACVSGYHCLLKLL